MKVWEKLAERRKRTTSRDLYYKIRKLLLSIGVGTDDCRTYNYWRKDFPLKVAGADASGIVHRGRGKTVIVLTDWGEGGQVRLTVDIGMLRLKPNFTPIDFETGQPIQHDGATLEFRLKKHDFKTIVIEDQE